MINNYQKNENSLSPSDTARVILKLSIVSQLTAETDREFQSRMTLSLKKKNDAPATKAEVAPAQNTVAY